ncbi:MAG: hypothetical protein ACLFVI_04030 [Archaeoglobaceae archaeon]
MTDIGLPLWHSHSFLAIVGTEIAYFVIVVLLCMIIYFKTREIYALTKYKGLFYFRNTFLFFAIAYFFRMLQSLYLISARTTEFLPFFPLLYFNPIVLFLTAYFSSMAILSLTFSTMWKRVEAKTVNQDYILNLIAIGIALITLVTGKFMFLAVIQLVLVLFAVALAYIGHKTRKTFLSKLHVTYILLFVFWITSLLVLARIAFLSLEFRAPLYAISIMILLSIAYRVVRRL